MSTVDAFGIKEQMFEDMVHEYDEAKLWLENLGVKIESGRFQSYKKINCPEFEGWVIQFS